MPVRNGLFYGDNLQVLRERIPSDAGTARVPVPPWCLARKFDYGYFPGEAPVRDWLIDCKPVRAGT